MNIEPIVQYVMSRNRNAPACHPGSIKEAGRILDSHPETSCLMIRQADGRYIFDELLCRDRTCIDRSRNVFDSVRTIVRNHRIRVDGIRCIFHFKGDACNLEPDFVLLSNSRNVGNARVILWPLLITHRRLFWPRRYNPYLHDEIADYLGRPDSTPWAEKAPVLMFRGKNSGNPFCSVEYPWNRFRRSRAQFLVESLKLPEQMRARVDFGFNDLYPGKGTLQKMRADPEFLAKSYGGYLRGECTIPDLQKDIELTLSHMKPALGKAQLYGYKYLFCPEGFDCSSALSWVLASNSLAIVPPFHYENVIINSRLLEPYVHFLPISEDYGDLAEVIHWALAHDDECMQMVRNANAYMEPFLNPECMEQVQKKVLESLLSQPARATP